MTLTIDKLFFHEQDIGMADLKKEIILMAKLGYKLSCKVI
jgi:hypothetical protein